MNANASVKLLKRLSGWNANIQNIRQLRGVALQGSLDENKTMTGIQFVTDQKGRKVGVLIDLKKHRVIWEDFEDGLISESRRKEKSIPYEQYRASRLKRTPPRG